MRKRKKVEQKTSKFAIASFVLGLITLIGVLFVYPTSLYFVYLFDKFPVLGFIAALMFIFIFLSPLILVTTIILSIIFFVKKYKNPRLKGKSLAILGVILSVLSVIISWWIIEAGLAIG